MYLYGGLIQSRISNDTTNEVLTRWERLKELKNNYPDLKIFASNVVMRIPSYDGDFEEPWYWASYGEFLFKYSFYADKFEETGDKTAEKEAVKYHNLVPSAILEEFVWRRTRNHNVTMQILQDLDNSSVKLDYFYVNLLFNKKT